MKFSIITLFPEVFTPILNSSILKRAVQKGLVEFELIDLRQFGEGRHQVVDDKPYGGGVGMILKPDVLAKAVSFIVHRSLFIEKKSKKEIDQKSMISDKPYTILTSPSGIPYKQAQAKELSKLDHLIIVCGHYEGVDQRFIDKYVTQEISIGDYVLTGGEIPAMVIVDSVTRLIGGVLDSEATNNESFSDSSLITGNSSSLLEHPHYTRPEVFEDLKVPETLLSGNHAEIKKWRQNESLKKTKLIRSDLLA